MKKILSGLIPIPGLHCLYSSLYNLFRFMGWAYEEHELFFLCNGMDFQFTVSESDNLQNMTHSMLKAIRIDYNKQVKTLAHRLRQPLSCINGCAERSIDSINASVEKALFAGRPVLAFLHSSILAYHILENPNENLGAHGLLLYGIDSDKGIVYLSDSFVTDYSNHVDTYLSTMELGVFYDHLIGLCIFNSPKKNLTFSEKISLFISDLEKYLYTKDIQNGGFAALKYILQKVRYSELDRAAYISLVFLLKAYFTMTLPYFDRLMEEMHRRIANQPFSRLHQHAKLQEEWNAFFLRCLCVSERAYSMERMINSGLQIAQRYREYLHDCLEYLYSAMEN